MTKASRLAALCLACAVPAFYSAAALAQAAAASPQQAVEELLAADRAFSAAAANADTVIALSAMFHDDIVMPLPNATFARGRAVAVAALRANPFNLASRAEWAPVRGGVSADGRHGFTFGYMILRGRDGEERQAKYLGYWMRTPQGWRLAAYKRAPRGAEGQPTPLMAPALPARIVAPTTDAAAIERHRQSLRAAEQAFSDEAQRIGVGPAFQRNGREDAMNMGRDANFMIGAQAIGGAVGGGGSEPARIHWSADDALVASSGDLGVTWGFIRPHAAPAQGQPAASPFFTIWRRDSSEERWLYIAE